TIAAAEAERRRWARDLHDETLQGLGAVKLALAAARHEVPVGAQAQISGAMAQLEREIFALRDIIADLRPPALDELGLAPALRSLAQRITAEHGLELDLELAPELEERRLDPEMETIAYRVAQEALTNVVKHAGATRVRLELRDRAETLALVVGDDGRGRAGSPERATGYGITGMRERAEIGGGTLRVEDGRHGGTRVELCLPLAAPKLP
ncbi:MAG: hypothetical protein JWO90_484, partial [Solirubrobacterales bacterium]|nr:hypothetical protein [Solirubrobacterales bacterium]